MEDAELALNLGAGYIGMILYEKSPRCVDLVRARDLCNRIPSGKRVFVGVNTGTDVLENYADLGFDCFQIHCDSDTPWSNLAGWSGIVGRERLWLAPKIPPGEAFPQGMLEFADTVLVDTFRADGHGGSGRTGDWQAFRDWSVMYAHKRWILAGGLNPDNIRNALAQTDAGIVDVNSGVEASPGIKDPEKLRAFFAALAGL